MCFIGTPAAWDWRGREVGSAPSTTHAYKDLLHGDVVMMKMVKIYSDD